MQIPQNDLAQLQQSITAAREILIITPGKATIDSMAASLALYLSLTQIGKQVSIASPEPVTVSVSNLVGIDKVKETLGGKNFIISLDYIEGSIEKVSYNIEGEKFNLVIEPRPGFAFSKDKVQYSYGGTNADLVIVVGARTPDDLGSLKPQVDGLLGSKTVVNIDVQPANTRFGKMNLLYPSMASLSEVVAMLLKQLGLPMDGDLATNLLMGISSATENFSSPKTTADSFEATAFLLRAGGSHQNNNVRQQPLQSQPGSQLPQPSLGGWPNTPQVPTRQTNAQPVPSPVSNDEAPQDWLKPKIFKSRSSTANPPVNYMPSEGKGSLS